MGPLAVPDGLQQEALNRAGVGAVLDAGVGVDSVHLHGPHSAAIERTLPGRVPTERHLNTRFWALIDALEVSDDLKLRP